MEKQKEEWRIEERDRRAAELQNQMFAGIPQEEVIEEEPVRDEIELITPEPEIEEISENEESTSEEEPTVEEVSDEEELMAEEMIEEEVKEEPKEKKNKQASLFDF